MTAVLCKGCYRRVEPELGPDGSVMVCPACGYGLAPAAPLPKEG